jgi:hypothetical protein
MLGDKPTAEDVVQDALSPHPAASQRVAHRTSGYALRTADRPPRGTSVREDGSMGTGLPGDRDGWHLRSLAGFRDTSPLTQGQTYSFVFNAKGTYTYDHLNPYTFKGMVIVK